MAQTPTRRGMLSVAALWPLAAIPATAALRNAEDPIVPLYQAYRAARAATEEADSRHLAIRNRLVARHGEVADDPSRLPAWHNDPEHPALQRIGREGNDRMAVEINYLDQIMETPATTLDGLMAKLQATLAVYGPASDGTSTAGDLAMSAVQDAARLLSASRPDAPPPIRRTVA